MDIYTFTLRRDSRRKLPCNTCKGPRKMFIAFSFDSFSWQVLYLPTAPSCTPCQACGLGHFHPSSSISLRILRQQPARSCSLASLHHPVHGHPGSDVQESLRERRKRKTELSHPPQSRHPGINHYWLLFLSIAERSLFKRRMLFCRELQEGSCPRAAAGACRSPG